MMSNAEIVKVVLSHSEGKKIQFKNHQWDKWDDCDPQPAWNFEQSDYRVAPEPRKPREWKIPITANGGVAYLTTEPITIVRVREVID